MFGDKEKISRDQRIFLTRLSLLAIAALCVLALLAARISHLTLARGQALFKLAEENYVRLEKIPAPRGAIVDRYGRVLANSETRFNLLVSPFKNDPEDLAPTLSEVKSLCARLGVAPSQVKNPSLDSVLALRPLWHRKLLAENLTFEQVVPFRERLPMLTGLQIEETFQRVYPYGRPAAFLTGYIQKIPKESKNKYLANDEYDLNDMVGIKGLEAKFEPSLRGEKGLELVHRNAKGRLMNNPTVYEDNVARRGGLLTLTVDIDLQCFVMDLLTTQPGAIVAMDPRNGEVLAMSANPNYDANEPNRGQGDSGVNKALRGVFAPGSTIKLITATAALMHGKTSPERTVTCNGAFYLPGSAKPIYKCEGYHGGISLRRALERSCNAYFGQMTYDLKLQEFVETAEAFGLGQPTGIELRDSTEAGKVGSGGAVDSTPPLGTYLQMGIGQGSLIAVSPMQMTVAYSTMANGGTRYSARLVREVQIPGAPPTGFDPIEQGKVNWTAEQHDAILEGLRAVIESPSGTGRHGLFEREWKVAGKTGTAQKGGSLVDAWFCCFAPWDAPEISITVLLEGAGHGGEAAAPVAKEILSEYYRLKEARSGKPSAAPGTAALLDAPPQGEASAGG